MSKFKCQCQGVAEIRGGYKSSIPYNVSEHQWQAAHNGTKVMWTARQRQYMGTSTHVIAQQKIAQSELSKIIKNETRIEVENLHNVMAENMNHLKIILYHLYLG